MQTITENHHQPPNNLLPLPTRAKRRWPIVVIRSPARLCSRDGNFCYYGRLEYDFLDFILCLASCLEYDFLAFFCALLPTFFFILSFSPSLSRYVHSIFVFLRLCSSRHLLLLSPSTWWCEDNNKNNNNNNDDDDNNNDNDNDNKQQQQRQQQ